MTFTKGDFVLFDGVLAVIIGLEGEGETAEGHVMLWYGQGERELSEKEGKTGYTPEVWSVPMEYCHPAMPARIRH